jgi:hypothetical protein
MTKRTRIPAAIQAKVQFDSDRTCCVCRTPGKPIQIHHIDDNPANHAYVNLAVLCRDCHDLTMIRGTFNRRLDADVVTLYRDDWIGLVAQHRPDSSSRAAVRQAESSIDFAGVVHKLEILKERKQYLFLAIEYDRLGNITLRDKYIELALKTDPSDFATLFLRSLQGQSAKVPAKIVARIINLQTKNQDWCQLARTYFDIRDHANAAISYCRGIIQSFEEGNVFSAAYYLKEMTERKLFVPLFQQTYEENEKKADFWWALRSLQELEWWSEADAFLLRNEERIVRKGDPLLLKQLYAAKGDVENFRRLELEEAQSIFSDDSTDVIEFHRPSRKRRPKSRKRK